MAIGNFGDGFMEGFSTVSRVMEERKRTKLLENQDKRQQEEWEQKAQDARDLHQQIGDVSTLLTNRTNQMVQLQKDAAANVPPPAAVAPPPEAAPAPAAAPAVAAAGLQPPPDAAPAPAAAPAAAAAPVKLNLTPDALTPKNLAAIAADRAKTKGIPLQQAMQEVTSAMASNGPAPVGPPGPTSNEGGLDAAGRGYAGSPPAAAGLQPPPEAAPAAAAPPVTPAAAAPASAIPAPAAEADMVPSAPAQAPNLKQMIDHARQTTAELVPKLTQILLKSNPVEGAKMAAGFANEAVQDRMTKTITLAGLLKFNTADPAVVPLLREVIPGYIEGSYKVDPPDAQGNQHARFKQTGPDGQVQNIPVFPAFVDSMLTTALSPMQILETERFAKDADLKEREFKSQDKHREAAEKLAIDSYKETVRQHDDTKDWRNAQIDELRSRTSSNNAYRDSLIEQRKTTAEAAQQTAAVNTGFKVLGIGPTVPADDPIRVEGLKSMGWASAVMEKNDLPKNSSNMARILPAVMAIRNGDVSAVITKDGQPGRYFLDTGVGAPLEMPFISEDIRKRIVAAQSKATVPRPAPQAGGLQRPAMPVAP